MIKNILIILAAFFLVGCLDLREDPEQFRTTGVQVVNKTDALFFVNHVVIMPSENPTPFGHNREIQAGQKINIPIPWVWHNALLDKDIYISGSYNGIELYENVKNSPYFTFQGEKNILGVYIFLEQCPAP